MNPLKPLSLALLLLALPSSAATTNNTITIGWDWQFPPDLGGLSTTNYLTNMNFVVYSATNVVGPYWQAMTLYPTNFSWDGGTNFWAVLPATNRLAFYKATWQTAGGESDFSSALPLLPIESAGRFDYVKGSR